MSTDNTSAPDTKVIAPPPPAGVTPSAGLTISADAMGSAAPLQTVSPPVDNTNHAGITTSVTQGIMDEYKTLNDKQDKAQANQDATGGSIIDSMNALLGKTADTAAANETAGVNSATDDVNNYSAQLANLNAQASSLNREAQAVPIQTQERNANTGATDLGVAPQNAAALRLNALKALSLGQQSDIASAALTGSSIRLQAAKDKAQQIIDLKYKPLEDALAVKQKQYDLNKDALTAIDAKRTEALGVTLKKEADDIATQKSNAKDVSDLQMKLAENGAPAAIVNSIGQATDLKSALSTAGIVPFLKTSTFSHFTDPNTGVTTIYDTKTGKPSGFYGGSSTDVNTAPNSATPPANQYALKAGDDPYNIAQQNNTNMDTLKALNPQITNWNTLPVGTKLNLPAGENQKAPYSQYGLLANTNYDPSNATDKNALLYLNQYLQGDTPSTRSMGLSTAKGSDQKLADIAQRARDLYSAATGNPLTSTPDVLKANTTLLNNNNKLLNNLGIQEGTVESNFDLALSNLNKGDLNGAMPFINTITSGYRNAMGDPYAAVALSQNSTLSQELANLLAVKNAGGTTVHDKITGEELLPANASTKQKEAVFKTILQEAKNAADAIKSQNNVLQQSIDPFQLNAANPDRVKRLNGGVSPDDAMTAVQTFHDADPKNAAIIDSLHTQYPNATITQIYQALNIQ